MRDPLVNVKLSPPALRQNNVDREDCLAVLSGVAFGAIGLIVAGAGSGKSTLLRQSLERHRAGGTCCGWLSLDSGDASVDSAWKSITAAFGAIDPAIVQAAAEHYDTYGSRDARTAVGLLSDGIAQTDGDIALFIDDFHFVATDDALTLFGNLFDVQTPNLKLIISARSMPHLPITSLKVKNRLTSLSWEHLNFSVEEAAQFFKKARGARIAPAMAETIHTTTDGWAAGMQLALLKLQLTNHDRDSALRLPGYGQEIADYFETEIYKELPPDFQAFLCATSGVDQMTDDLAAHVSGVSQDRARAIFQDLEERGFFIVRLDEHGQWKRYHHLFQDLIGAIRDRDFPDMRGETASKASHWHEIAGMKWESIDYALRAQDHERAAELVERHSVELFNRGAISELADCIRRMPSELSVRRPQLPIYLCFLYAHMRHSIDSIIRQQQFCRTTIDTLRAVGHFNNDGAHAALQAELDAVSTLVDFRRGDMRAVATRAEAILNADAPLRPLFSASLHNVAGFAHHALGDNVQARRQLAHARVIHMAQECVVGVVYAECFTGLVEMGEARGEQASAHFQTAVNYASASLGAESLPCSTARLYATNLAYEMNKLEQVENDLPYLLNTLEYCCEPAVYAAGMIAHHKVLRLASESKAARDIIDAAASYARRFGSTAVFLKVSHARIVAAIAEEDTATASAVFAEVEGLWEHVSAGEHEPWGRASYWRDLIRAEILVATARPRAAIELYNGLAERCLQNGRIAFLMTVEIKTALALASVGDVGAAMTKLLGALEKCRTSGFIRTLLDAGPRVTELIRQAQDEVLEPATSLFCDVVLDAGAPGLESAGRPGGSNKIVLEELTERELAILKCLVNGFKNREICSALQLSENTVKWYLKRIFSKLGATNRTEAALVAKSLFAAL